MKLHSRSAILTALTLSIISLSAQENPPPRPPDSTPKEPARRPDGDRPHHLPGIFGMLDANRDGGLDLDELNKAAEVLRKLDRNNDHKISPTELQPDGHRAGHERSRADGDRQRHSESNPPSERKDGGDRPQPPQGDKPREQRSQARDSRERADERRDAQPHDRQPQPPGARRREEDRGPRFAHRPHASGDQRREQGRPQLAPRMEGAAPAPQRGPGPDPRFHGPRPPMASPHDGRPDHGHAQPRRDGRSGDERPHAGPPPGNAPQWKSDDHGPRRPMHPPKADGSRGPGPRPSEPI